MMDRGTLDQRDQGGQRAGGPPASFSVQMREFLHRNTNWFVAGAFALLLLQDVFGAHGLIAMRRSQREAAQIQQEINRLGEENRQLQDRVKALKSDPAAIERIAREEMGLARPGEYIFKLPAKPGDPGALAAPATAPATASPQKP
jgi:cell division protein FtsB